MSGGRQSTCGIQSDGSLWCWGDNYSGELGTGDTISHSTPTRVGSEDDWASVSVGLWYACGIKTDQSLWCWGRNFDGDLGFPGGQVNSPTHVGSASWLHVSAASAFTCGVQTGHTLWCWGDNGSGNLGTGDTTTRTTPTQVGADDDWKQPSASNGNSDNTCATKLDGTLWCWGDNLAGQLGLGDTIGRLIPTQVGSDDMWTRVSTGGRHTCAAEVDHSLWCWGLNSSGELGLGNTSNRSVPVQVGTLTHWTGIDVDGAHSCSLRLEHTLWCWGSSADGELGVGNRIDDTSVPVQVGPPNQQPPTVTRLAGVTTLSTDDAWAVGYATTGKHVKTVTDHWNGSHWTRVPSPNPGGSHVSKLLAVAAIDADDIWAVGVFNRHQGQGGGSPNLTLTEHWDGTTWSWVPSPNDPSAYESALHAVGGTGPDDVWAVGSFSYDVESGPATIALHWNGSKWAEVETPDPYSEDFHSIAAVSPTDVWAAGAYSTLDHYDGATWIRNTPGVGNVLAMSASGASDIWAVGGVSTLHYDGSSWNAVAGAGLVHLDGVSTLGPSVAIAVGGHGAEAWNGSSWSLVTTAGVGRLAGVSLDSAIDGWAVGHVGRRPLIGTLGRHFVQPQLCIRGAVNTPPPGGGRVEGAERTSMPRQVITSLDAPSSPYYSQAVKAGPLILLSGMTGMDVTTGALAGDTIQQQTRQALANCRSILRAADADLGDVIEVGVLLTHPEDFAGLNEEYVRWFPTDPPTRSVTKLGVDLPGLLVSIRMTAFTG